ncbi:MAG: CDP-diacylglycerol--glycerol-3-phosphate 3-phosphatidyltransferase [Luteolibacter sp.]
MTLASKITVMRLCLVPVFVVLAISYGLTVQAGNPQEWQRWAALGVFVFASVSDAVDGWIARRFNQYSAFGAFMDPLADKTLLLSAIVTLANVDWGPNDWRIPSWFMWLVIARDCVIVFGLWILRSGAHKQVKIAPHWSGKVCTVAQMFALGWVMLKIVPFSPIYPCAVAAVFTLWSGSNYLVAGTRILRRA